MSFFGFGGRKKSPADLVKAAQKDLPALAATVDDEKEAAANAAKISETLTAMKFMLYGDSENDPKKEEVDKLTQGLLESEVLLQLLQHMKKLEFEARKDVANIYNYILRQVSQQAVDYVRKRPEILTLLVDGYKDNDIALNCGSILRECIRSQPLAEQIIENDALLDPFFEYVQKSTFDVASDAFASFKAIFTRHKAMTSVYLEKNFDKVFAKYNMLLESQNYVTKRQSLKLLGELLLDRSNFKVMMKYINDPANLKIMMNLLRGTTKAIQFEAFHVFKIFVANPQKSQPVADILTRNRDKLIEFLQRFQTNKDDEQFAEEKRILLSALQKLPAPTASK